MTGRAQILLLALALAGASGCASVPNPDPSDPLEGFNRSVYRFNDAFDRAVAKPVATAYKEVLPNPVRNGVRNFFSNIADLFIGVNNLLQGKPEEALTDWGRFAFNTTFGMLGIADWATDMGLDKHNEDFGQTLGRWSVGSGPYVVLPFLGPSDVRDSFGTALDMYTDPVSNHTPVDERNSAIALRLVSQRADLLDASRLLEQAALDPYLFMRDAYLQRRRSLIYDGRPPREPLSQQGEPAGGGTNYAAQR
ncbi:MAG: VacJ family lipoprotein [Burkholderiales bacterium]